VGRTSAGTRVQRSAKVIAEDRETAVSAMNSKLKRKLGQVEKMIADSRESNLRFYHQLGKICQEVRDDPDTYSRNGYRLLEQALYTQKRTLRKARSFAEQYNDERLATLIALVNEGTGYRLHWGHMTYLLGLNTEKQQDEFAERAVRNLWDPPALHAAIKKRFGDRGVGGGRPHKLPATTHMQIRQMMETSRNWVNKRHLWNGDDENVFANIVNEAPDELTDTDLENLRATVEYLDQMITEARQMKTQIGECATRIEEVFRQRAKQAEEEANREVGAGKQHRSIDLGEEGQTGSTGRRRRRATAPAT